MLKPNRLPNENQFAIPRGYILKTNSSSVEIMTYLGNG